MNAHEQLDKFLNASPKKKVLTGLVILAVIIIALGGAFWYGTIKRAEWADSKYLQDREKTLQSARDAELRAKFHLEEAAKYAKENEVLKAQNELQAEILRQNDTKLAGDAKRLTELMDARNARLKEIDSETSEGEIICGTCEDAKKAGFPLSEKFCARCK